MEVVVKVGKGPCVKMVLVKVGEQLEVAMFENPSSGQSGCEIWNGHV